MYEYDVIYNGEEIEIYGYSFKDACRRMDISPEDVKIIRSEYID